MSARAVILIRHGSHDELGRVLSGRSEVPLNDAGRAEAAALARALDGEPIASIHASPRARTRATAAAIAAPRALPVSVSDALDEIDFGAFAGRRFDALAGEPAWQRWNAARDHARCPGGETMAEAVARTIAFLRALPASQCPAVCVTHCDIIRGVVAAARGEPFGAIYAIGCDPGSRTTVTLDAAGNVTAVAVNTPPR